MVPGGEEAYKSHAGIEWNVFQEEILELEAIRWVNGLAKFTANKIEQGPDTKVN